MILAARPCQHLKLIEIVPKVHEAAYNEVERSMGVTVYSRLGKLLRGRNLTVADLQDQIAARFGLAVDARTLDRLAREETT